MIWLQKYSYKEFDNEKKFPRLENSPPPPLNFPNGPSLIRNHSTERYKRRDPRTEAKENA